MTFDSQNITTESSPQPDGGGDGRSRATQLLQLVAGRVQVPRYSGLLLCVALIVFFSIQLPETFLTKATFTSIAGDQSVTMVLALGLLVTLAVGQFDLSAAQNLGMSAMICSVLMVHHNMNPGMAVLVTLLVGLLVGLVNAIFVAVIGIDSLIATLGTSSVLLAVTGQVSNYQFVGPVPSGFQEFSNYEILGLPIVVLYAVVLCLLAWYVLEHTPVGRRAFAVGANPDASRLAGVRTGWYIAGSFVVTSLFAAIAGVLVTAKIGNVAPTLGPAYLLPSFAACFLGTTQLKPGRFNVGGTVIALVLLAIGVKGLQLSGNQLWVTDLFSGVALLAAVSAAVLSAKRRPRRKQKEQASRAEGAQAH
ncbi:ABC transporter permease [Sinosporangium siamense]|uniref:Dolichyl-phosphate beta-glucosyltransferase n=1 Tax=Sinosporangium siamense TaxID=1367973 RepID=A0A919RJL9_9ACTN|nr:ABC transporter permease [Sinosporangium siamense]GII94467.1 dolichyl-phosphate beta-glucosyltransferase [Sinosporangium siamense]